MSCWSVRGLTFFLYVINEDKRREGVKSRQPSSKSAVATATVLYLHHCCLSYLCLQLFSQMDVLITH